VNNALLISISRTTRIVLRESFLNRSAYLTAFSSRRLYLHELLNQTSSGRRISWLVATLSALLVVTALTIAWLANLSLKSEII
jgi:hypothetical protein